MEEALRAWLLAQTGVSGLIGTRVFWGVRPQGSPLPALVLNRISGASTYTYKGRSSLRRARVQLDSYGDSNASARSLQRAVLAVMDGKVFTQGGIWFQSLLADERDLTEPGLTDAETVHRISTDFNLNFKE